MEDTDVDVKKVYEISKLTNTTKQILDDFNTSITMLMFTQFLKVFDDEPKDMLNVVLDRWEQTVILQKEKELEALTSQTGSMFDMTLGATLAGSEDMIKYIEEVSLVKNMLELTIGEGLDD